MSLTSYLCSTPQSCVSYTISHFLKKASQNRKKNVSTGNFYRFWFRIKRLSWRNAVKLTTKTDPVKLTINGCRLVDNKTDAVKLTYEALSRFMDHGLSWGHLCKNAATLWIAGNACRIAGHEACLESPVHTRSANAIRKTK